MDGKNRRSYMEMFSRNVITPDTMEEVFLRGGGHLRLVKGEDFQLVEFSCGPRTYLARTSDGEGMIKNIKNMISDEIYRVMRVTEGEIRYVDDHVEMDAERFFGVKLDKGNVLPKCCYGATHILAGEGGVDHLRAGVDCDVLKPIRGIERDELVSLIFGMSIKGEWKGEEFHREAPPGLYAEYQGGVERRRNLIGEYAKGNCGCREKVRTVIKQILLKNGVAGAEQELKSKSYTSLGVEDALLESGAASMGLKFPLKRDKRKKWIYRGFLLLIMFGMLVMQFSREFGFGGGVLKLSANGSSAEPGGS